MTKDEIVKALRACGRRSCGDCPYCKRLDCDTMSFDAADLIEIQQREINAMRNELCQRCGRYKAAHEGACDGCRWKEEAT